ncbi:hypothetical protein BABINDRAFT_163236 [Babjeviella inositovora NRRL Y-12698]|uniref:Peptidase S59 domain-containing protein n=1 Tax=Babjeviella inositovora NRRL Y-12698 TaxID=984486 RepID=A0A1E3QJJ8_9ASCO|nr:uncharacterized protein BABINDRAFT_163236 [Babjeviella inositovora NRRL Y-12698]ODQ77859.1 hypothetical protein BABINDRAFT_163236 [Babjeviella inositovora NRRL Y-12698]
MFGSSNTSNNIFGNSQTQNSGGSMFGSAAQPSNTSFGQNTNAFGANPQIANNATLTNLFGTASANTGSNNNSASTFGTNTNAVSNGTTNTGFGASSTPASNGVTSMFGNSNGTTGTGATTISGFGNNTITAPGMFGGNSATTPNTFGNNSAIAPSTFGNNSATAPSMFGNSSITSRSGLFGNRSTGVSSGMFGNSSGTSGTFGNSGTLSTTQNPYTYGTAIPTAKIETMPKSLTAATPPVSEFALGHAKRKRQSVSEGTASTSGSLLNRLGNTLRFFSKSKSREEGPGLFTTTNTHDIANALESNAAGFSPHFSFNLGFGTEPVANVTKFQSYALRKMTAKSYADASDIKKLVIKHQPSKFNLIDANEVLIKRRRIAYEGSNALVESDDDVEVEEVKETPEPENNDEISVEIEEAPKHNDYWCSPSVADLSSMNMEQLANVENFIVGRVGFGSIRFNYPVDITKLAEDIEGKLFDNIVKFNTKNVQVYSNISADEKPPMGQELNIPSTITIEKVFPKNPKRVHEFTKSLQHQRGMEFVTYDPTTGIWVFKVKHFSVWGIVDDADEEIQALKQRQDAMEAQAEQEFDKLEKSGVFKRDEDSVMDDSFDTHEQKRQKMDFHPATAVPGGWELNLEGDEFSVVNRNMDIQNEIARQLVNAKRQPDSRVSTPATPMEELETDFQLVKALATSDVNMDDIVAEKPFEPVLHPSVFDIDTQPSVLVADDWSAQLEMSSHLHSSLAPEARPVSAKPRICMEDVDRILFGHFESTQVEIEDDEVSENLLRGLASPQTTAAKLQTMIARAKILKRNSGFPKIQASALSFTDLVRFHDARSDYDYFWRLCSKLFDQQCLMTSADVQEARSQATPEVAEHVAALYRRQLVTMWIHDFNNQTVTRMLAQSDSLETIFGHLCANDLNKAVELAIQGNNKHLAVLISLLGSNDASVKYSATRQLAVWKETGAIAYIAPVIIKIYQLLTGDVFNTTYIDVTEGLAWSVSIGLELYYGDLNQTLRDTFEGCLASIDTSGVTDVCLSAMKLYVFRDDMAAATTLLSSDAVPVELRWFVFTFVKGADATLGDALSLEFAEQLENSSLIQEAVFVLSHMNRDEDVDTHITRVVMDRIDDIQSLHYEHALVNTLHVPRRLIDEAIAAKYRSFGDYWNEASALLDASNYAEAHATILENVAPNAVISGGKYLDNLQQLLDRFANRGRIVHWSSGAGVYAAYIQVLRDDREALTDLLTNLPVLKLGSFQITVAANLMARKVADRCLENPTELHADSLLSLPLCASDAGYVRKQLDRVALRREVANEIDI